MRKIVHMYVYMPVRFRAQLTVFEEHYKASDGRSINRFRLQRSVLPNVLLVCLVNIKSDIPGCLEGPGSLGSGTTSGTEMSNSDTPRLDKTKIGLIIGLTVLGAIVLAMILFLLVRRWRRRHRTAPSAEFLRNEKPATKRQFPFRSSLMSPVSPSGFTKIASRTIVTPPPVHVHDVTHTHPTSLPLAP